eukprot:6178124-Pleurochrysis_carterae.AAC.2
MGRTKTHTHVVLRTHVQRRLAPLSLSSRVRPYVLVAHGPSQKPASGTAGRIAHFRTRSLSQATFQIKLEENPNVAISTPTK